MIKNKTFYSLKMEQDKYVSLQDAYIETQGVEKDVLQFQDDILNGKITFELSTNSLPKAPVKLTQKNL